MSPGAVWLAFLLAGLITFTQRSLFFWLSDDAARWLLPDSVKRALRYVAPAAFAAIALPRVLGLDSSEPISSQLIDIVVDARFLAAAVACVVMWRVGRLPLMLVTGMALFWLLRALGI